MIMLPFAVFGLGVVLLLGGADLLVRSASKIAKTLGISEFVIGVTVVAFGTSIPEVGTSVYSALIGHTEIAYGNVVGSNVANIALVLGIASLFGTFAMKKKDVGDLPVLLLSAALTFLVAVDLKVVWWEGIILMAVYAAYLYKIVKKQEQNIRSKGRDVKAKTLLTLLTSIIFIYLGARLSINGAVEIASIFGISESVIGFTLVALSTSLPELAASVIAVFRKKIGISIGNIIGSNIFNSLIALGAASLAATITLSPPDLLFQVPAMLALTIFLVWTVRDLKITKLEGMLLILAYLLIIARLF